MNVDIFLFNIEFALFQSKNIWFFAFFQRILVHWLAFFQNVMLTPIASLGGNPHLRQSDPVFCRCDALNLPQRCRPAWQLTESLLPPRSWPPLYLLRSKKLQENQLTSFFRIEPEIFCSQQQTKFVHSTRGYPARYSLGVIPVWVLKNLWNDGIDWKLRR